MDERHALHTAARRACIDRTAPWDRLTEQLQRTRDLKDPRWKEIPWARQAILDAILRGVERLVATDFGGVEALRAALLEAGREAEIIQSSSLASPPAEARVRELAEEREIAEERERWLATIAGITAADLAAVPPLPYRRVLSDREVERILRRVQRRWGAGGARWYPLLPDPTPPHLLAVQADWFWHQVPVDALRHAFAAHRIHRVWHVWHCIFPDEVNYEVAPALLRPLHNGREGFWTSERMDWVMRASHEASLTIGGQWLIGVVKQIWPEWEDHVYSDYFYERPPRTAAPPAPGEQGS